MIKSRDDFIYIVSLLLGILFLLFITVLPFLFLFFLFLSSAYFVQAKDIHQKRRGICSSVVQKLKLFFTLSWIVVNVTATLFLFSLFPLFIIIIWALFLFMIFLNILAPSFLLSLLPALFFIVLMKGNYITEETMYNALKYSHAKVIAPVPWTRSIFSDDEERNIYFTVQQPEARRKRRSFYTLYRTNLTDKNMEPDSLNYFFCPAGVYDAKRKNIKLVSRVTDELLTVDDKHLQIIKKHKIRRDPDDIIFDETSDLLLVLYEEGGIGTYDPVTLKEITFSRWPCCVSSKFILSQKQKKVFIASLFTPITLTTADGGSLKQLQRKVLGLSSWGVDIDSREENVYLTDFFFGRLYKLDADTLSVKQSSWIKSGIRPVEIDEKRKLVYVGNYLDPYLLVLDENFNQIKKIFVGKTCRDIKLLKNGRLFVATQLGLVEVHVDEILKRKN